AAYEFDFDANGTIDTTAGEIALENAYSATNINVDPIGISTLASASTGEGATADGGSPSGPVVVESAFGGAYGVNNFEVVIGGAADDAIVGNDANNILAGNAGADRIAGLGGADTIYGGKGDDYIIPGEDADVVNGGEGINTILITSSDLAQDTFAVDPNGINIFKLNGDGSSANTTAIAAPTGTWNPGAQGIDLLDGGDPEVSAGVTIYDTINGTTNNDDYQFGSTAFKNISDVNLGAGDDSVGTAPTSKGIKVSYDGESGSDAITLTLTFQQFARLNQSGLCVADVQNYIDAPTGQTFRSNQADFTATNFESGGVAVVTPALYNALQGDPAALTFNSSIGLQGVNTTSSGALDLIASALTSSSATAFSSADLVSAFVQANSVKGADAVVISSGTNLSGTASADHNAAASAITVDDRSDAVLSAYGLGVDRSSLSAGGDLTLNLTGRVAADTVAEAGSGVVTANGTAEAAGSRDSSLTAAGDLRTTISGTLNQSVNATTSAGLTSAGLASRTYGIDDANLTDANPDSLQAGGSLELSANATSTSEVAARSTNSHALGAITLVDNGVASTDRFTVPASLWGARFPLINGDRIRFASTPAGSSLEANRDYFVLNVIPVSGEFQLSSTPAGDPIDVLLADDNTSLEAFRPSIASADAISSVTAVDLNRSGVGVGGLQAGGALNLQASASDSVRATASSVTGEATAGLNRLGGLDNLDGSPVSPVVSLSNTASFSDGATNLQAIATEAALLQAASTAGDALAEGNVQVLGSERSASSAGDDLRLLNSATLSLTAEASSTSGRAEARSGAGAGAGSSSASAALGNALPDADTYAIAAALRDGSQSAGGDLSLNANASLHLNAAASSTGGATTLSSLWSDAGGTVLSTFDPAASTPSLIGPQLLADGQQVQLDTTNATALGLDANTSYRVRLLASTAVDAAANTITMPTDITYSDGDAIRFRLNSTTAANASASRYGLELGTTYYVVGNGSTFQLATAPGGAVIDLTPDSTGLADQLVDADRFQLLQPPATPGAPATVANLTAGQSGLSLTLPSESLAFAGSRQSGPSLADPATLDLARVQGLDGSALAAGGGLLSLLAGADNAITAAADGVVTALARNTTSSATASAGLVAEGLNEVAITAAEAGTVNARATINAVAEAASTGDNALLDTSPSSLNLAARAIDAAQADQDIRLGSRGVISADAAIDGRSSATLVSGAAEALAALESTGLRAGDAGISITIGGVGDLAATARLGSAAAPVIISALSGAAGHAVAEGASQVTGILGHYDSGSSDFSALQVGTSQGDIRALASSDLQIQAVAAAGTAAASLTDVSGAAPAVVSGIHDMALSLGADLSRVESSATGRYQIEALAVGDAASVNAATSALGLLSDNATALPVDFAQNGAIAALANNTTIARALSVAGDASSNLSVSSLGLSQAALTIAGNADLDVQSLSRAANQAQSVQGNVSV
ncbi:MAG: beta strand repeat-containing protein, partial [Cyanobium sp.]